MVGVPVAGTRMKWSASYGKNHHEISILLALSTSLALLFKSKFYLQGSCLMGDDCSFVHDEVTSVIQNYTTPNTSSSSTVAAATAAAGGGGGAANTQKQRTPPTVDDFPSLPSTPRQKSSALFQPEWQQQSTASSTKYSPQPASSSRESPLNNSGNTTTPTTTTTTTSSAKGGKKGGGNKKQKQVLDIWSSVPKYAPRDNNSTTTAAAHVPKSSTSTTSSSASASSSKKERMEKIDMSWLNTGGAVASVYHKYRADAAAIARHRNALFQRATDAYISGDKAGARRMAAEGRAANEQMLEMHRVASEQIFAERNRHLLLRNNNKGPNGGGSSTAASNAQSRRDKNGSEMVMVDLHALHPDEAIRHMHQRLLELKRQGFSGKALAIAGTGHHSRSGKAKVLPLLKEDLLLHGYKVRDGTISDTSKGGIIVVYI